MPFRIDDARATGETDKGIWVDIDGDDHFIPQSQIDEDSEVWKKGDEGVLIITDWLADERGMT